MQFLVLAYDGSDEQALERRMAARPAHIALGDELRDKGKHLFATAVLDDAGKMIGSMLVVEFQDRAELDQWLAVEPYVTGNVWKQIEVCPCRVGPSFARS